MKRSIMVFSVSALLLISVSACKKESAAPGSQAGLPAGHPPVGAAASAAPAGGGSLSGKVVETMNSGGYTYVAVENGGRKT